MSKPHTYTEEQREFIRAIIHGRPYQTVTDMFNAEFGTDFQVSRIKGIIKRLGLVNGRNTQFYPRQTSWNKDRKGLRYSPATEFKKGHRPQNWKPVGSERITKDGYIEVKTAEPKTWKLKHRVIWEQHNRPIPKGFAIIFADSNKLNCDIANLLLVSRAELLLINQYGLQKNDKKLTKTGINIARVLAKIHSRSKE